MIGPFSDNYAKDWVKFHVGGAGFGFFLAVIAILFGSVQMALVFFLISLGWLSAGLINLVIDTSLDQS